MERYQVILAYDGTHFHGSQYQKDTRTVQGVVELALGNLGWSGKRVLFAGRTDAGVHASGQVVTFDLEWNHPPADLAKALNALLPDDVAVQGVTVRPAGFHPRFWAQTRTYRYCIFSQPYRDPLRERFAWRVWPQPEFDRLRAASQVFLGVHDFAGYGRATSPGGSTIRHLMAAEWVPVEPLFAGPEWYFEVRANAFLYHMVRRLVFAQIAVGQTRLEVSDLRKHLEDPQDEPLQGLAPAAGLTLYEIQYPSELGENQTFINPPFEDE